MFPEITTFETRWLSAGKCFLLVCWMKLKTKQLKISYYTLIRFILFWNVTKLFWFALIWYFCFACFHILSCLNCLISRGLGFCDALFSWSWWFVSTFSQTVWKVIRQTIFFIQIFLSVMLFIIYIQIKSEPPLFLVRDFRFFSVLFIFAVRSLC